MSDTVEITNAKEFYFDKQTYLKVKEGLYKLYKNSKYRLDDDMYNECLTDIINYIVYKIDNEYILYQNLLEQIRYIIENDLTNIELKEKFIKEMLKLLKCDSVNANLKFINSSYSMAFGKKNDRIIKYFNLIETSPTGIYTKITEFKKNEF